MKNKTLGILLAVSYGVAMIGILGDTDSWTSIGGLGMWIFGVWAMIRLYNLPDTDLSTKL